VSDSFINELKSIAAETDAAVIVDESGTGFGATGKGLWQYEGDSDYLVFGKRSIVSGYFSKEQLLGFGGDEHDVHLSALVYKGIKNENLIEKVKRTSGVLKSHHDAIEGGSDRIKKVRIVGT